MHCTKSSWNHSEVKKPEMAFWYMWSIIHLYKVTVQSYTVMWWNVNNLSFIVIWASLFVSVQSLISMMLFKSSQRDVVVIQTDVKLTVISVKHSTDLITLDDIFYRRGKQKLEGQLLNPGEHRWAIHEVLILCPLSWPLAHDHECSSWTIACYSISDIQPLD